MSKSRICVGLRIADNGAMKYSLNAICTIIDQLEKQALRNAKIPQ